MKKLIGCFLLAFSMAGCISERSETGMSEAAFRALFSGGGGAAVRPAPTPAQPVDPLGTGLAMSQASPEPTPSASPEVEPIPQAVPPPPLESIEGVQEIHTVSSSLHCRLMEQKFQQQGLRLRLTEIIPLNQPGRSGNPRAKSKRIKGRYDNSSSYGRMFACRFVGMDAVKDRYSFNDDFTNSGLEPPENYNDYQHPNDYRQPEVEPTTDPANPNRRTVPDPDPNRPDPYKDLPF